MHYEAEIFISPQNFKIVILADGKFNWTNFSTKEIIKNFFELERKKASNITISEKDYSFFLFLETLYSKYPNRNEHDIIFRTQILDFLYKHQKSFYYNERKISVSKTYEPIFLLEANVFKMHDVIFLNSTDKYYIYKDTPVMLKMSSEEIEFFKHNYSFQKEDFEISKYFSYNEFLIFIKKWDIKYSKVLNETGNVIVFADKIVNEENDEIRVSLNTEKKALKEKGEYFIYKPNYKLIKKLRKEFPKKLKFYKNKSQNVAGFFSTKEFCELAEKLDKDFAGEKIVLKTDKSIRLQDKELNMSLTHKMNFTDFKFKIDGIEPEEIPKIIKSVSQGKRYIELSTGELLKIANENNNFKDIVAVIENLTNLKSKNSNVDKLSMLKMFFSGSQELKEKLLENSDFAKFHLKLTSNEEKEIPELSKDVQLYPYQETGFQFLRRNYDLGLGSVLGDDMGLGKTLQTIALIKSIFKEDIKILIVAIKAVTKNWQEEIRKFSGLESTVLNTIFPNSKRKNVIKNFKSGILITTFGLIKNDIEELNNIDFDLCIIDEAHEVKKTEGERRKNLMKLNSKVNIALTGTAIENGINDLWSIFDFVLPGFLGNYTSFNKRYSNNDENSLKKLRKIISPFYLRRLKEVELKHVLPQKQYEAIELDMKDEQKKEYFSLIKSYKESDIDISDGMEALKIIGKLLKICNFSSDGESIKLEWLLENFPKLINEGHRMLIFSHFVTTLDIIKKNLNLSGYEVFVITGNTSPQERLEICNRFNSGEKYAVLISINAGGTGLNLTGADTVIHFDQWWNMSKKNQATDRAYRLGQKKDVKEIDLLTVGTIENDQISTQLLKDKLSKTVLDGNGITGKNIKFSDMLKDIFKNTDLLENNF